MTLTMVFTIFFACLFCHLFVFLDAQECGGGNGKTCCVGYRWNPTIKNCTKCDTGFTGPNCTRKCPQGTSGQGCQHICSCDIKDCHHVFGCLNASTQTLHSLTNDREVATDECSSLRDRSDVESKLNQRCVNTSTHDKSTRMMMMIGVIVLAAVFFIVSLSILFIHQQTEHLKLADHRRNMHVSVHV